MTCLKLSVFVLFVGSFSLGSPSYRLPKAIIPSNYKLFFEPFFNSTFNFTGNVSITAQVTEETKSITLHSLDLRIDRVQIFAQNQLLPIQGHTLDKKFQILTINLVEVLKPMIVLTINIDFEGILNLNKKGFYRAKYLDKDGKENWIATTQFEPTFARQAFPCFDEPALKATFEITIKRRKDQNSISNSPLNTTLLGLVDSFQPTPNMSTYLVAFVISNFEKLNRSTHDIYARKQFIEEGRADYALNISQPVLKTLENLTGIPFAMPKMTQIAIPDDWFNAGAMENWGLVTYRERYLLIKDTLSSSAEIQKIVEIISHEYAHQWFGNLVTPKWWNHIWLNEGFARYYQFKVSNLVEPNMRVFDQFVPIVVQKSLDLDFLPSARIVSQNAESPEEIDDLFDFVAYDKAASLIRMAEHLVTPYVFAKGIQRYLNAFKFDMAEEDDLWNHLQRALDDSIAEKVQIVIGTDVDKPESASGKTLPVKDIAKKLDTVFLVEKFEENSRKPNSEKNLFIKEDSKELEAQNMGRLTHVDNLINIPDTIGTIMKNWTQQQGYPVVYVERKNSSCFVLKQQKFSRDNSKNNQTFYIPINFITKDLHSLGSKNNETKQRGFEIEESIEGNLVWFSPWHYFKNLLNNYGFMAKEYQNDYLNNTMKNETTATTFKYLIPTQFGYFMTQESLEININLPLDKWIIFNPEQIGYYRVNYSKDLWRLIIEGLKSENFDGISPIVRSQLLNDAFSLARAGELDYEILLELLTYARNETDYIPLTSFFNGITYLDDMLSGLQKNNGAVYQNFQVFIRFLLNKAYNTLGIHNTGSHVDKLSRARILNWMSYLGEEYCISELNNLIHNVENRSIEPDLQAPAYCGGMIAATLQDFVNLWKRFNSNQLEDVEKERIIRGLGWTTDVNQIQLLLSASFLKPVKVQIQIFESVLYGNSLGLDAVLNQFLFNFKNLEWEPKQKSGFIKKLASKLSREDQFKMLRSFLRTVNKTDFETSSDGSKIQDDISESWILMETNEKWVVDNLKDISNWLSAFCENIRSGCLRIGSFSFMIWILCIILLF